MTSDNDEGRPGQGGPVNQPSAKRTDAVQDSAGPAAVAANGSPYDPLFELLGVATAAMSDAETRELAGDDERLEEFQAAALAMLSEAERKAVLRAALLREIEDEFLSAAKRGEVRILDWTPEGRPALVERVDRGGL